MEGREKGIGREEKVGNKMRGIKEKRGQREEREIEKDQDHIQVIQLCTNVPSFLATSTLSLIPPGTWLRAVINFSLTGVSCWRHFKLQCLLSTSQSNIHTIEYIGKT